MVVGAAGTGQAEGFDISGQASDLQPAADSGRVFAFFKASEGPPGWGTSSSFKANWNLAKKAGILRGAFHFFHGEKDGAAQADFFYQTVKAATPNGDLGELPPVLDCEDYPESYAKDYGLADQPGPSIFGPNVLAWVSRTVTLWGRRPLIYTGSGFWTASHVSDGDALTIGQACDLWQADWNPTPHPVRGWEKIGWTFWQYKGDTLGVVPGIPFQVDLDRFRGDLDQLTAYAAARGGSAPGKGSGFRVAASGLGGVGPSWVEVTCPHGSVLRLEEKG